jgi:hypothetical protein
MDAALHELVRQRAGNRCEYCRLPQEISELHFHLEHIIPRQHGGTDDASNLAFACPACNLFKGPNLTGIDPKTRKIVRLFHPRRQKWDRHFAFAGAYINSHTSIGRATIAVMKMNDPERLRVRTLLLGLGALE